MLHKIEELGQLGLDLIEQIGYIGIFIISFLENVFTPLPSEFVIPFAGVLAEQGRLNVFMVILVTTLGSLAGAYIFYYLGYFLGQHNVRTWITKYGKYVMISEKDLDRAEKWFIKYESWAVLICRVIPLVRSFISIPAGYVKMNIIRFTLLTAVGTAVWSAFLVYLGYFMGTAYMEIVPVIKEYEYIVIAIGGLAVLAFLIYRRIKSHSSQK